MRIKKKFLSFFLLMMNTKLAIRTFDSDDLVPEDNDDSDGLFESDSFGTLDI